MNSRPFLILFACVIFSALTIVIVSSLTKKVVQEPGSFIRVYKPMLAVKSNELDIKYNSWYLAGADSGSIYLGNYITPQNLLISSHSLIDTHEVKLQIAGSPDPVIYKSSRICILGPFFYLGDGIAPKIYRGMIGEWVAKPLISDYRYFNQITAIGPTSFAVRTKTTNSGSHVLGKFQVDSPFYVLAPHLLQKQVDGIFCTDGLLQFNKELQKIIYLYRYRNQYIVYDTNMNLIYRGNTIDTCRTAKIKTFYDTISKKNQLIEKRHVNLVMATSGRFLFVSSNTLAKNDMASMLKNHAIIDVYDLNNGKYKFSFSLPNYDPDKKLMDVMVFEGKVLYAIYDHYIIKYDLNRKYF